MGSAIAGVIIDIDGVLIYQGRAYRGAVEFVRKLREHGLRVCYLTNSTLNSRHACALKLRRNGFWAAENHVITASYATAHYLRACRARSIWLMLTGAGRREFDGIQNDTTKPEFVVIGDFRNRYKTRTMNKALRLIVKGAKLIGMIPELTDTSLGQIELNVGSWVRMLETAAGCKALYIGKPNPYPFKLALQSMCLPADKVMMIGDRADTDIAGAQGAGMRTMLVRTGEYQETRDITPDVIVDSIIMAQRYITNEMPRHRT